MKDFFEIDVPEVYQKLIVNRFVTLLAKGDVAALRDACDHYNLFMNYSVVRRMEKIFYDVDPERKMELLEELFKDYALI